MVFPRFVDTITAYIALTHGICIRWSAFSPTTKNWRSYSDEDPSAISESEQLLIRGINFYLLDVLNLFYFSNVCFIFTELRNVPNTAAITATVCSVRIITSNSIPTTMAINITPKPNSIKYDQSPLMSTCRPIDLSSLTRVIILVNRSTSFQRNGKHTNAIYFTLTKRIFDLMYCRIEEEGCFTRSEYAMAILKSFIITTIINVNDTKPVAFQPSTFVMDNSVRSKSTSVTFYK